MAAAQQISLIIDDSLGEFFKFSPDASTHLSSSGFYNGTGTLASPVLGALVFRRAAGVRGRAGRARACEYARIGVRGRIAGRA